MIRCSRTARFSMLMGLALCMVLLTMPFSASAQQNAADIFGTKAYLENLMVERFSRELATRIDNRKFEISANIEVSRVKRKKATLLLDDNYTDIDLGFLDPEKLLSQNNESQISSFLRNFEVRKINVMAGIKEELGDEVKAEVTAWLSKRVKDEFGSRGSSEVLFIKTPATEKVPEKVQTPLEMLRDFQELAGQLLLALALLLGIIVWKVLSGKAKSGDGPKISVNNKLEGAKKKEGEGLPLAAAGGPGSGSVLNEMKEKETIAKQISNIYADIKEITPKLGPELGKVIEEWCQKGEEGYTRVAIFAEVVGQSMGRVPIPPQYHESVTAVFSRMHEMNLSVKLQIVNQVYWDMMAVLNLGSGYLHEPFSFLKEATGGSVAQALMENSDEMQVVASVYMSREARESYFGKLDKDAKMRLLSVASNLEKMEEGQFLNLEGQLAPMFEVEEEEKMISMTRSLEGLVEVMPHRESIFMLNELSGPVMEQYKRTQPSLAFVHLWPDESLNAFIQHVGQQELMALLVLREDMYKRVLDLVPPRLKQIISDDYKTAQKMSDAEIEQLLEKLHMNLILFVDKGLVDLQMVFANQPEVGGQDVPAA
ncbi:MAG: hypothetical protein HRT45_08940 [Bdellovibrionales bacterium]|nr:hypothetical protein [Bdellovibrionales bacterium]